MKFVTTLAALSIAAMASASAGQLTPSASQSTAAPTAAGEQAPLQLAGSRGYYRYYYSYRPRCTEDLGYGRTGSYGCG
jgi:hypothetical protein